MQRPTRTSTIAPCRISVPCATCGADIRIPAYKLEIIATNPEGSEAGKTVTYMLYKRNMIPKRVACKCGAVQHVSVTIFIRPE